MKHIKNEITFDKNNFNKNLYKEYFNIYSNTLNNKKNSGSKNEKLLLYILTYNIHGTMPSEDEISLLFPPRDKLDKIDVFVINTQECLRSIAASFFNNSKEPWELALSKFFGENYINIINSNLGALHIAIFVKKEKAIHFHDLRNGEIKTGFMNIVANKGACSVSMKYCDKHILFACCHLTAGQENESQRNEDLLRISNMLQNSVNIDSSNKIKSLRNTIITSNKSKTMVITNRYNNNNNLDKTTKTQTLIIKSDNNILSNENNNDKLNEKENSDENKANENENLKEQNEDEKSLISECTVNFENKQKDKSMDDYDFVILSGDLNYRLNINKEEINNIMEKNDPEILWDRDQFTKEIKENKNFKEGKINFMPTYKFKEKSNEYDYYRIPGWTDRILYRSKKLYDIMLCEYSSIRNITISDHRPVYAVFKINFKEKNIYNDNFNYQKSEQECNII